MCVLRGQALHGSQQHGMRTHKATRGVGDDDAALVACHHAWQCSLERADNAHVIDAHHLVPVGHAFLFQEHACKTPSVSAPMFVKVDNRRAISDGLLMLRHSWAKTTTDPCWAS